MSTTIIHTAPTQEPITMDDLLLFLRISDQSGIENDLFNQLITTSREYVEEISNRKLLTQTWNYYPDRWPANNYITIPFGNLQTVTHVKWYDTDGDATTLTENTDYYVETNGKWCGRIVLPYGETWPSEALKTTHPIEIRFVCGCLTRSAVPNRLKIAMKMICADLYMNREGQSLGGARIYFENKNMMNFIRMETLHDLI